MDHYTHNGLTFDVRDAGPADGPVVVLLHGFPQHNDSWDAVIDRLTARGYRCLAPNQRGYCAGARPPRRRDYRIPELVGDLRALIDAGGAQRVHLVGHDWGAAVAWVAAAEMPERLITVSPVSVPHPAAINWYRAMPLLNPRSINQKICVPTLYVWSDQDIALLPKAAYNTGSYVTAEYRFEIMAGVSHWIPDEEPDKLAGLLLDWFAEH
jgi:pimeloyl-ACP methyl ester carboxylesterase